MKFGTIKFLDKHIARAILANKDESVRECACKGICAVYRIHKSGFMANVYFKALMIDICKENGFYSGSSLFPIFAPSTEDAMEAYLNQTDLWDETTIYGQRRHLVYEEMNSRLAEYAKL